MKNHADERIEALLNRAGQTIQDLPKEYEFEHAQMVRNESGNWCHENGNERAPLAQYACHLCDVIDRMEIALENALNGHVE